jgi:hypothetical protein
MILNAPRNMARAVVWTLLLDDGSAVPGPRVSQRHYFLLGTSRMVGGCSTFPVPVPPVVDGVSWSNIEKWVMKGEETGKRIRR